jgi:hypothetical protein
MTEGRSITANLNVMSKNKNTICSPGKGIYHDCGWKSERRIHKEITDKELRRPFYYSQWYNCTNPSCRTNIFMKEVDRVYNSKTLENYFSKNDELERQNSFFSSL